MSQKYESFRFLSNLATPKPRPGMVLIYAPSVPNRLRFISRLIFEDLLGLGCGFTTSEEEFSSFSGPGIAYAPAPAGKGIFIKSHEFLFGKDLRDTDPGLKSDGAVPLIFPVDDPASALPFDPFAASFYMASRYEEYSRRQIDRYGRFPADASAAVRGRFLDLPVVHFWADMLAEILVVNYNGLKIRRPVYSFTPTIDIDHVFAFKGRGPARTAGGILRSILGLDIHEILLRFKVLAGVEKDPFDTYSFIRQVHSAYQTSPLFFILTADYGGNDNNISPGRRIFGEVVRDLQSMGRIGIHPSFSSGRTPKKLGEECERLAGISGNRPLISRQHFMKVSFPQTYRNLVRQGITDDYSMGYASMPGFRSGLAIPFPFFDLMQDEATNLKIHPVALMDVTMKDYQRLTPEKSIETIHRMISMTRSVGGEFISLFHNETFSESGRWIGWRKIYEELLRFAIQ